MARAVAPFQEGDACMALAPRWEGDEGIANLRHRINPASLFSASWHVHVPSSLHTEAASACRTRRRLSSTTSQAIGHERPVAVTPQADPCIRFRSEWSSHDFLAALLSLNALDRPNSHPADLRCPECRACCAPFKHLKPMPRLPLLRGGGRLHATHAMRAYTHCCLHSVGLGPWLRIS